MKRQSEMLKLVRKVHLRFVKFFSREFASRHLSHPQYMMLMSLEEDGAQKMNSLAELLQVSTPAVTNLVDRLEAAGHVRRAAHPGDRRAHMIELTPRGERVVRGLRDESLRLLAYAMETMPAADRRAVLKFYRNLLCRLDEALGRDGSDSRGKQHRCHPCVKERTA